MLIFRRIQLYTCSIWYCHSLWEFLVACRYTDKPVWSSRGPLKIFTTTRTGTQLDTVNIYIAKIRNKSQEPTDIHVLQLRILTNIVKILKTQILKWYNKGFNWLFLQPWITNHTELNDGKNIANNGLQSVLKQPLPYVRHYHRMSTRDSSVSIATRPRAGWPSYHVSFPGKCKGLSFLWRVQTGAGVFQSSSECTGCSSCRD